MLRLTTWKIQTFREADPRRDRLIDQRVHRGDADNLQHLGCFDFVGTDVAGSEGGHYLKLATRS